MLLPKYQRFVAWRYLMERHRRVSGAVASVVQACFWVAIGMGAACLWFPLSDPTKVPPPNPPLALIMLIGVATVLPIAGLFAAMFSALRSRSPVGWLLCSVHWGLLGLATFALYRRGVANDGWNSTELAVGWVFFVLVAIGSPQQARVLWAWGRDNRPSTGSMVRALLFAAPANLVRFLLSLRPLLNLRPQHSSWRRQAVAAMLSLQIAALEVPLLAAAYFGLKTFAWPILSADDAVAKTVTLAMVMACLGLLLLPVWLIAQRRSAKARSVLPMALALLGLGLSGVVVALYLHGVREVGDNLEFLGGWSSYTPPMGLIMPAIVAGAIAILAMVLLAVRYFFTFFTTVSIGGVTIGTMALVIVLSVMSGFESDLREKILGFNAHIQISKTDELQFDNYRKVETILKRVDAVVGYTPFLITEAYMSNHTNYGNVTLKGIDPDRVAGVTEIVHNLEKGDERALAKIWPLAPDGSILGAPAQPGDPDPDATRMGPDLDLDLDLDEGPTDFSGGLDEAPDDEDTAIEELDLGPPIDFSGGLEVYDEPDAGPAPLGGDAGIDEDDGLEELEEWETEMVPNDYVSPEVAVLDGVLVGRELANQIHLYTDQEVRVISPLPDVSPDGLSIPRMKNVRIAGRFFSGMYEYDLKYVYCSLSSLQDFLDLGDVVNGIEVRVRDPRSTGAIVQQLEEALGPGYKVQDWKELNKALFSALKLEKIAMFFILVLIVLVASFSIIGNLIMVVIEKAKEIAILKTLGSSDPGVMKIFVTQGFFIGLVGTSLGLALGLGACYLGKTLGVPLDPDVYYIDKLPIQVELGSVAAVGLAGLVISVVATLYPAYLAARMRPVKGLRWNS